MEIKVSSIIPVYNAENTIDRAMRSVLDQRFERCEIIAVDDGSADRSTSILESYGKRLKLLKQPNRGAAAARNAGARISAGEYLAFLDADDVWLPDKLQKCVEVMDRSPQAVAVYSDILCNDGRRIVPFKGWPSLDDLLSNESALFPSAAVVRRRTFEQCGGFSEEFGKSDFGEDTFMGLRLRECGDFVHIAEPLVIRYDENSLVTLSKYPRGFRTFARLVKERYGSRGNGVVSVAYRYYASMLTSVALDQIKNHRASVVTLWDLLEAATVSPSFIAELVMHRFKRKWHRKSAP